MKNSHTFRDMYNKMPIEVDYELYKRVLDEMCKVILEHIFNRSEGFKMPYGLGFIQICKYKPKQISKNLYRQIIKVAKNLIKGYII